MRMDSLGPRTFCPAGIRGCCPMRSRWEVDWKNWMVSTGRGARKEGAAGCEDDTGWSEGQK